MTSEQNNSATRVESDTMGDIEVANDVYWAAQTQRSLTYFNNGFDTMLRSK